MALILSETTAQFSHHSTKAVIGDMQMRGHGCVPVKLFTELGHGLQLTGPWYKMLQDLGRGLNFKYPWTISNRGIMISFECGT